MSRGLGDVYKRQVLKLAPSSLSAFPRCETVQPGRGRCIVVEQEAAVADARFVFISIESGRGKQGGRHRQSETDGYKETHTHREEKARKSD